MYTVYCDNVLIHNGASPSKEVHLISPSLKIGDNIAGSFDFTVSPSHVGYSIIEKMTSTIVIYKEDKIIWKGRPINETKDFWNNRQITCEGALAFLNDTIQEMATYQNYDLTRFFRRLITIHNSKVSTNRQIEIRTINKIDNETDYVYRTDYKSTYEEIKENLIDRIGGHLRIEYRQQDGMPMLDYLEDYPVTSDQEINFGSNLLDFTKNWDLSNLCTVILPKGKQLETDNTDVEADYTTIASVNGGNKYIESFEACEIYGRIEKIVEFSDCDSPSTLLDLAHDYMSSMQFAEMTLEVTALDLHNLDPNIPSFELLDLVHCISSPHGLDRNFPITEITIPIDEPANVKYVLNGQGTQSMSARSNSAITRVNRSLSKITPSNTIISTAMQKVDTLLVDYAHITDGVIDNASIDHANVNDLSANYAHIYEGVIDNASISYASVDELQSHYAHIENGVIDNAFIEDEDVLNLNANYAHITNGAIDNASIGYARVDGLEANYAKIVDGVIDNATIDQADVNNLNTYYAHITDGEIDNAKIGYADVKGLAANYASINMQNVNNSWIENGVIKNAAITDSMIHDISANKLTAGEIDASQIRVYNLNANNITVGRINGQLIGTGTVDLTALEDPVYTKSDVDGFIQSINERIDSTIETFTGSAIPTMNNTPASDWATDDVRRTHVGDIYYVVNQSLPENGYSYRFSELNGVFSWELVRDTDVTATLAELRALTNRVANIEQFDTTVSTWKTNTEDEISVLTTSHTTLAASVDKVVKKITQLWYTKAYTSLPSTPTQHVTSTGVGPNQWTTVVPIFDSENPNYFYCYEYEYVDGTYSVSDPVFDRAMTQAQGDADGGIIASYQLWITGPTTDVPEGPTGIAGKMVVDPFLDKDVILDSLDRPVIDNFGNDYTANLQSAEYKEYVECQNLEYLYDSDGNSIDDNDRDAYLTGLRWTIEVPKYDPYNPNYFYCWEYHYIDGTVGWSDGVFDRATTDAQKRTEALGEQLNYKVDVTTFNELKHTTDENSATITRMSEVVTNNYTATTQSVNTLKQTVDSNLSKIQSMTTRLGLNEDGTGTSEDVVFKLSELSQDINGFKTAVSETYSTKAEVDSLTIGGRNLLRLTKDFTSTSLNDEEGDSLLDSSGRDINTSKGENGFLVNAGSILTNDTYRDLVIRTINMVGESASTSKLFVEYKNVIVPEANTEYILNFYVKGTTKVDVYFTNGTTTETIETVTSAGPADDSYDGHASISINNIWSRVWVKWKIKTTATGAYRNVVIRVFGQNIVDICGMKFEEGNRPTAWSPAPEDSETYTDDQNEKNIHSLLERVIQTESKIVQNSEYIGLKADRAETYTITQVDGLIESGINTSAAALEVKATEILGVVSETYATKSNVNGLTSRISTAESNIQQNATNIGLKANQSDVYTKADVNGLITTEITNRNSAINLAVDGISQSVSRTYTTKQEFARLAIGGRNYLMLTESFDDTYLSDSNGATILDSNGGSYGEETDRYLVKGDSQIINENYHTLQARYLNCSSLNSGSYKEFALYKNVIIPVVGNNYVFSFFAKGTGKIRAYFYPNPMGGTCSALSSQDETNTANDGATDFTLTSEWTRYWVKWTIGGSNSNNAYRHVLLRLFGGNTATVAGLKFEEGDVATSWSPAPEDDGITFEQYKSELERKIVEGDSLISRRLEDAMESIVSSRAEFKVEADNIRSVVETKTDRGTIISAINQSAEEIKISAEKIDFEGAAIFNSYAKKNVAVKDSQYIYISKNSTSNVAKMLNWVTDTTGNQNIWTTKRPIYSDAYPYMFIARQDKFVDDTVSCTSPMRDESLSGFTKDSDAIAQSCIIYISKPSGSTSSNVTVPSAWVTNSSGTQNTWSIARQPYDESYPDMWTAVQYKMVDGTYHCTTPLKDNTTTGYSRVDSTVKDVHTIYISKSSGTGSVTAPSNWISDRNGYQNQWTTKRPEYNSDYPVVFVATQRQLADGSIKTTTPVKDETTTVIDGGHITTGTIDASRIDVSKITVSSLSGADEYVQESQIIYISKPPSTTEVSPNTIWVTDRTGSQNTWTTKRPTYNASYPKIFMAIQHKMGGRDGTVSCNTPEIDRTTDGYSLDSNTMFNSAYVYISKAAGTTSVTAPTLWVTDDSGLQNRWTLVRPQYNSAYPVLFVALQKQMADGSYSCTTPKKDETTTVIDGGHITTGVIDASHIDTSTLRISNINGAQQIFDALKLQDSSENLIKNGDFTIESNAPWNNSNWSTTAYATMLMYDTDNKCVVYRSSYGDALCFTQSINCIPGARYKVIISVPKNHTPSTVTTQFGIQAIFSGQNSWNSMTQDSVKIVDDKQIYIGYITAPNYANASFNFGVRANYSDTDYYLSSVELYKVTTSQVVAAEEQIIYRSSASNTNPGAPAAWVTLSTNSQNNWTTTRPQYRQSYPYCWIAKQSRYLDGSVTTTTPVIDQTTTVIDGGNIITGSITASKISGDILEGKVISGNKISGGTITGTSIKASGSNGLYISLLSNGLFVLGNPDEEDRIYISNNARSDADTTKGMWMRPGVGNSFNFLIGDLFDYTTKYGSIYIGDSTDNYISVVNNLELVVSHPTASREIRLIITPYSVTIDKYTPSGVTTLASWS